jgi:hypothetical protein
MTQKRQGEQKLKRHPPKSSDVLRLDALMHPVETLIAMVIQRRGNTFTGI